MNRITDKKYVAISTAIFVCLLLAILFLNAYAYQTYTVVFNHKIEAIVSEIEEKYPDISETEIMSVINSAQDEPGNLFEKYGIDVNKDVVIRHNNTWYRMFLCVNILLAVLLAILLAFLFLRISRRRCKDIRSVTDYIVQINQKNYDLDIDAISEDPLSILKHEIYKTTVMLREEADNSDRDKLKLKESLEDISHQLRTPLTSILIMLDNLIDEPEIRPEERDGFIRSIKKETFNIYFLIQALLILSRSDAGTLSFIREEVDFRDVIEEAVTKVAALCDLKNIKIEVAENGKALLKCDARWQTEAITNILKNSAEHSHSGQKIQVNYAQNSVYTLVEIRDFGDGIDPADVSHIFERFYKGTNADPDSIGIGLALAKSIVEEDNGAITVESDKNGTTFKIKYFTI